MEKNIIPWIIVQRDTTSDLKINVGHGSVIFALYLQDMMFLHQIVLKIPGKITGP